VLSIWLFFCGPPAILYVLGTREAVRFAKRWLVTQCGARAGDADVPGSPRLFLATSSRVVRDLRSRRSKLPWTPSLLRARLVKAAGVDAALSVSCSTPFAAVRRRFAPARWTLTASSLSISPHSKPLPLVVVGHLTEDINNPRLVPSVSEARQSSRIDIPNGPARLNLIPRNDNHNGAKSNRGDFPYGCTNYRPRQPQQEARRQYLGLYLICCNRDRDYAATQPSNDHGGTDTCFAASGPGRRASLACSTDVSSPLPVALFLPRQNTARLPLPVIPRTYRRGGGLRKKSARSSPNGGVSTWARARLEFLVASFRRAFPLILSSPVSEAGNAENGRHTVRGGLQQDLSTLNTRTPAAGQKTAVGARRGIGRIDGGQEVPARLDFGSARVAPVTDGVRITNTVDSAVLQRAANAIQIAAHLLLLFAPASKKKPWRRGVSRSRSRRTRRSRLFPTVIQ